MDRSLNEKKLASVYEEVDKEIGKGKKRKKKSRIANKIIIVLCSMLWIALLAGYIRGVVYFREHFFYNTFVNGVDFSLQTTVDARYFVESKAENFYIAIIGEDGVSEKIFAEEVDLIFIADSVIEELFEAQNPFAWPFSLFEYQEIDVRFELDFDEELLDERVSNLDIVVNGRTFPVSADVIMDGLEVVVVPHQYGNVVNVETLQDILQEYVGNLVTEFNAADADIFFQPELTTESDVIVQTFNHVNRYLSTELVYQVGREVVVDRNLISDWVSIGDNFSVHLDEEQVQIWLNEFIWTVNTHGTTRSLTTPRGRSVTVTGGYYGWIVARDLEFAELLGNIRNGDKIAREPIYFQRATVHGPQDWGSTFLQVDMTEQHMWAFINGQMVFEAPVVTGLPRDGRNTPQGVYFILEMLNPTVLIGATDPETGDPIYETPVDYWMRTTWAGHGFHDATWQESFGGTRYRRHGSHGCTNLSLEDARTLYNLIYLMMPVVVHY